MSGKIARHLGIEGTSVVGVIKAGWAIDRPRENGMDLSGNHHLTAISADMALSRCYTTTLGMRLVKRSVNQDDVSAPTHGFAVDEDPATLGENVVLPPFLLPDRQQILSRLKPSG